MQKLKFFFFCFLLVISMMQIMWLKRDLFIVQINNKQKFKLQKISLDIWQKATWTCTTFRTQHLLSPSFVPLCVLKNLWMTTSITKLKIFKILIYICLLMMIFSWVVFLPIDWVHQMMRNKRDEFFFIKNRCTKKFPL